MYLMGGGVTYSGEISEVMFLGKNNPYAGYWYTYGVGSVTASAGAQLSFSASVGGTLFIAGSNSNVDSTSWAGETKSIGVGQDIKDVVGAGWLVSYFYSNDWSGIWLSLNVGVGESANLGSVFGQESKSVLFNSLIPTDDRGFFDKMFNMMNPTMSGVLSLIHQKISR